MRKLMCNFKMKCMFDFKNKFFISSLLVGGVLLALAFSLVPQPVSAISQITYPSNDSGVLYFQAYARGGCAFKDYELTNGTHGQYLTNPRGNIYCGYRYDQSNQDLYITDDYSLKIQEIEYAGTTPDYEYPSFPSGTAFNPPYPPSDFVPHLYSTIDKLTLSYQSYLNALKIPTNDNSDKPYMLGIFSFGINGSYWNIGVRPFIDCNNSFDLYNAADDSPISHYSDTFQEICLEINSTAWFTMADIAKGVDTSGIPDGVSIPSSGNHNYQAIIYFAFPQSTNYYYKLRGTASIISNVSAISSSTSKFYNAYMDLWQADGFNLATNPQSLNFLFRSAPASPYADGTNNAWNSDFFSAPTIQFLFCTNATECDNFQNYVNLYKNRSELGNKPSPVNNGGGSGASLFSSWWDIFNFSFLFPFRFLFTSFSNDNCVNIPIIAGMLHAPSSQYCSWWSNDVRNTLTPVLNIFGMMLLTGFVVHWLGYNNKTDGNIIGSLAKGKGGE